MKKSLFRLTDMFGLSIVYIFCFSLNLLLDYAKTLDLDAYILKAFLKNFIDYQPLIVFLFTFIVTVFHYQMTMSSSQQNRQKKMNEAYKAFKVQCPPTIPHKAE